MATADPQQLDADGQTLAFVGIGANLGHAEQTINSAITALAQLPSTSLLARSSLYRTTPVDSTGPDYVNAVVSLDTALEAAPLLRALLAIELRFGRERSFKNAPRTLDLDLLLYDKLRTTTPELILPHPRMHQRAFVLVPLAELAPGLLLEPYGEIETLLDTLSDQPIERLEP